MAATRFQKAFQTKRRTAEVDRLTKQFQQQTSGLLGEYGAEIEKKKGEYESQLSQFNKSVATYEDKLKEYNKKVNTYKQTLSDISEGRGDWVAAPISGGDRRGATVRIDPAMKIINPYVPGRGYATAGSMGFGHGYDIYIADLQRGLPGSVKQENGQYYIQQRKADPTPVGEFGLKAPTAPAAPDLTMAEEMQTRKKSLSSDYEREIAERKAGRVGSVSRRAQSRPMLSKGVTV
jgi:hypothetical protein